MSCITKRENRRPAEKSRCSTAASARNCTGAAGVRPPLWSAQVMIDEPELVETVHLEFIEAGAQSSR